MRYRRFALLLAAVVVLVAIALWIAPHREQLATSGPSPNTDSPASNSSSEPSSQAQTSQSTVAAKTTASPIPTPFAPADEAAMIEVDKVGLMIRDYRTIAGENPVGTNAEIMASVMGGNPKEATLGPPEGMQLNDKGELIDRWGTPYFFHQLSRDQMEIRSAGADKIMWTDDDAVTK